MFAFDFVWFRSEVILIKTLDPFRPKGRSFEGEKKKPTDLCHSGCGTIKTPYFLKSHKQRTIRA